MFSLKAKPLGTLTRYSIQKIDGSELEILANWGAGLNAWKVPTTTNNDSFLQLLYGYQNEESFWKIQNDTSAGVKLAPWPGRTNNAQWTWKNKTYTLDNNVTWAKHALHGLVHQKPWQFKSFHSNSEKATLELCYEYTGNHPGFPFPFKTENLFIFTGDSFTVISKTTNIGSLEMPYAEGFHPYFSLDKKINDLILTLPKTQKILVDSTDIPTGERVSETRFNASEKLSDTFINDCFYLEEASNKTEVTLASENYKLSVWQNANSKGYRYLQIYTAPDRNSIAIEPMTSEPDVLNHHRDLILLQPKESVEFKWGAEITACHQ